MREGNFSGFALREVGIGLVLSFLTVISSRSLVSMGCALQFCFDIWFSKVSFLIIFPFISSSKNNRF